MDVVAGPVFVQKCPQSREAPVGDILTVPQSLGRSVGDENVNAPCLADGPAHFENAAPHLPVCVLVLTRMVFEAAPQTHDPHTVVFHHAAVDAVAALGWVAAVAGVVVPVDIEHGAPGHGHQKAQIAGLQVPAGYDQLIVSQTARHIVVPKGGAFFVGEKEYLHVSPFFPLSR